MTDISFLPGSYKEKEEELKKQSLKTAPKEPVSMHVPETEEEDVEIIEVDASEVNEMLIGEPLYTKLYYKASLLFDTIKDKYFQPRPAEKPPKEPPQFFKPPKGEVAPAKSAQTKAEPQAKPSVKTSATEAPQEQVAPSKPSETPQKPKARIKPKVTKPRSGRRVRIIKRIRKPVHVSLIDERTMRDLHINIPKRKFTLVFLTILFAAVFGGAYLLLDQAIAQAVTEQKLVQSKYAATQQETKAELEKWRAFQDLEPRLIALNELLGTHVSAVNVLKFLEENTLKDISYSSFMMSEEGRVNLAVTAQNYNAAARQLLIFKESPQIISAESNAFNSSEQEGRDYVSFQLILQLEPSALLFSSQFSNLDNQE